ncbi:hypothetical protein [Lentzea sp. NPDC051838]|uniref:hypothetical protein n=1 Tax=Lentzea sp. NPDC051838 TaxID=3154849 RepID=UPI00343CA4C1
MTERICFGQLSVPKQVISGIDRKMPRPRAAAGVLRSMLAMSAVNRTCASRRLIHLL